MIGYGIERVEEVISVDVFPAGLPFYMVNGSGRGCRFETGCLGSQYCRVWEGDADYIVIGSDGCGEEVLVHCASGLVMMWVESEVGDVEDKTFIHQGGLELLVKQLLHEMHEREGPC